MTIFLAFITFFLGFLLGVLSCDKGSNCNEIRSYICKNCHYFDGKKCAISNEMRASGHNGCEYFKYIRCNSECSCCMLCEQNPEVRGLSGQQFSCDLHK